MLFFLAALEDRLGTGGLGFIQITEAGCHRNQLPSCCLPPSPFPSFKKKKLLVSRGLGSENHGDDSVVFLHQGSCGAGSLVPLRPCPEIQLSVNRPGQRCLGGRVHVGEWG